MSFEGLFPDEITQVVKLPPHLREDPYLQEFYGTVEWSSKAVFGQYMGWFSGNASELHPLPPKVCLKLQSLLVFGQFEIIIYFQAVWNASGLTNFLNTKF